MSFVELISFDSINDDRGNLISLEQHKNIPFDIKRIYYIFGTKPGVNRGFHAHKDLQQVAVCISGSCDILLDDGNVKKNITLDSPCKGVFIKSMVWREMSDFSFDCVLLVLASEVYDEADYIRDYQDFKNRVKVL